MLLAIRERLTSRWAASKASAEYSPESGAAWYHNISIWYVYIIDNHIIKYIYIYMHLHIKTHQTTWSLWLFEFFIAPRQCKLNQSVGEWNWWNEHANSPKLVQPSRTSRESANNWITWRHLLHVRGMAMRSQYVAGYFALSQNRRTGRILKKPSHSYLKKDTKEKEGSSVRHGNNWQWPNQCSGAVMHSDPTK